MSDLLNVDTNHYTKPYTRCCYTKFHTYYMEPPTDAVQDNGAIVILTYYTVASVSKSWALYL